MAAITIFATLFIATVFLVDFSRTLLDLHRDRQALKAYWKRTKAGGFGV